MQKSIVVLRTLTLFVYTLYAKKQSMRGGIRFLWLFSVNHRC